MARRVARCTILEIEAVEATDDNEPAVRQIAPWQDPWINQLLVARGLRLPLGSVLEALGDDLDFVPGANADSTEPLVIGPLPVAASGEQITPPRDELPWWDEDSAPLEELTPSEIEVLLGSEIEAQASADSLSEAGSLADTDTPAQTTDTAETPGIYYRVDRPGHEEHDRNRRY